MFLSSIWIFYIGFIVVSVFVEGKVVNCSIVGWF